MFLSYTRRKLPGDDAGDLLEMRRLVPLTVEPDPAAGFICSPGKLKACPTWRGALVLFWRR
jgi:hypothetical protein